MIEANGITLAFGARTLLDNVSFQLSDRGRLCLAGSNGAGKSTLFSILMNELGCDAGKVIRSGGLRMGMLRQHAEFPEDATAYTAALLAFADVNEKAKKLEQLHLAMGERELTDAEMHDLDVFQDALIRDGYYTAEAETRSVLHGLGFKRDQQDKLLSELSGGWKMRVALAQLLLQKPDCLLLDEPTNHLDLESIMWLEGYLRNYPGSMMLICHDRRFVDNVCEGVLDLRMGKLDLYSLPYEKYEEERAMRVLQQQKSAAKAQDEIAPQQVHRPVQGEGQQGHAGEERDEEARPHRGGGGGAGRPVDAPALPRDRLRRVGGVEGRGSGQALRGQDDFHGRGVHDPAGRQGGAGGAQRRGQDDADAPARR
jgi:ATP-binding cassette subfamily F protein 3